MALLLNSKAGLRQCGVMKHTSHTAHRLAPRALRHMALSAALIAIPTLGHAACYAEYKAKRDNPLKLHYGVAQLSDEACTAKAASAAMKPRLAADGWILLSIVGLINETEIEGVKANAGDYFLRY